MEPWKNNGNDHRASTKLTSTCDTTLLHSIKHIIIVEAVNENAIRGEAGGWLRGGCQRPTPAALGGGKRLGTN
jgi:hypothetical protein